MAAKLQGIKQSFGPVRFSFVNIFEQTQFNNNDPQYSLRALIPKENKQLVDQINAAISAAKEEGRVKLWGGNMPEDIALTIHDGDKTGRPEEAGHWCLNTNNKNRKPGAVIAVNGGLSNLAPATEEDIQSGDYGLINVTFKAYDYGKKGIGAYLNSVCKTKTGESLSGASNPVDDFKDMDTTGIEFDEVEVDPLTGQPIQNNINLGNDFIPF